MIRFEVFIPLKIQHTFSRFIGVWEEVELYKNVKNVWNFSSHRVFAANGVLGPTKRRVIGNLLLVVDDGILQRFARSFGMD